MTHQSIVFKIGKKFQLKMTLKLVIKNQSQVNRSNYKIKSLRLDKIKF